jgi:hypothetical protein
MVLSMRKLLAPGFSETKSRKFLAPIVYQEGRKEKHYHGPHGANARKE